MNLPDLFIGTISITGLTLAFTQALKEWFSLDGKKATALSFGVGTALSVLAQYTSGGLPADAAGWITVVVAGLGYGLAAAGFYKFVAAVKEKNGKLPSLVNKRDDDKDLVSR